MRDDTIDSMATMVECVAVDSGQAVRLHTDHKCAVRNWRFMNKDAVRFF